MKSLALEYRKGIPNWFMDEQAKEIGKVIDYETLVVKVRVSQWWKGEPLTDISLLTRSTKNAGGTSTQSSCDYTFSKGETYLIFATKYNTQKANEYRTSDCLRTRKLSAADDDLKILGEGKKPSENNDELKNSMEVRAKQRFCYRSCPLNFSGLGGGFAPRHLKRSTSSFSVGAKTIE